MYLGVFVEKSLEFLTNTLVTGRYILGQDPTCKIYLVAPLEVLIVRQFVRKQLLVVPTF